MSFWATCKAIHERNTHFDFKETGCKSLEDTKVQDQLHQRKPDAEGQHKWSDSIVRVSERTQHTPGAIDVCMIHLGF
jgi:hypothetical protein